MKWEYHKETLKEEESKDNYYVVGIDLGTTNSVISYWNFQKGLPEPIDMSNGFGKAPLPSVVQYRKEGLEDEWIVGEEALNSYLIYPRDTIMSVKKKMGSDEKIRLHNETYSPEEISAKILQTLLKQIKNTNPKAEIAGIVVSVPYDFDDAAKKATMKACELAGIHNELICLIEEPKAAALAYNLNHPYHKDEKIMVFDFGGGTLDITIFQVVEIESNVMTLKVLSEGGKANHGGDHIDQIMYSYFKEIVEKKGFVFSDLSEESKADVLVKARETKERLSGTKKCRVPFSSVMPPFAEAVTREKMEELCKGFIEETKELIMKALREAYEGAIHPMDIDKVLLEGGSSQMPWVKDALLAIFHDSDKIYSSEKPALDISVGATLYAAMKMEVHKQKEIQTSRNTINFEVVVPHDIGFEIEIDQKNRFFTMISKGTPYKLAKRSQVFTINGENEEDMTKLNFRILERIHHEKEMGGCSLIGDVSIDGLPKRPKGQTQIRVDLAVNEETLAVDGVVEDIGYMDIFPPSGFRQKFVPKRHEEIKIIANVKEK